jgi:hypothetical protein
MNLSSLYSVFLYDFSCVPLLSGIFNTVKCSEDIRTLGVVKTSDTVLN